MRGGSLVPRPNFATFNWSGNETRVAVAMFSSKEYLEKKTGLWGVGRFKYLQALVTEFQDTSKHEHKQQVLANLANFAYDPINYEHFRRLNILDLFLGVWVC